MPLRELVRRKASLFDVAVAQTGTAILLGLLVETLEAEAPGFAERYREHIQRSLDSMPVLEDVPAWDDGGVEQFLRLALVCLPKSGGAASALGSRSFPAKR
jgi:hypothetical protein